jgi:phosphoglycerate-specific signal transduction histidine kinase
MSPAPILDTEGHFKGSFAVITDVTERKEAQDALRKKESELLVKAKSLEEVNTTLRVLLKEREKDKTDLSTYLLSM